MHLIFILTYSYRRKLDSQTGQVSSQTEAKLLSRIVDQIHELVHRSQFITNSGRNQSASACPRRAGRHEFDVQLYSSPELTNFLGNYSFISEVRHCRDLSSDDMDKVSSINTNEECVILYAHEDCQGLQTVITPGIGNHGNLRERGFNDEARSIRVC